jgi:hypothetical protein
MTTLWSIVQPLERHVQNVIEKQFSTRAIVVSSDYMYIG